MKEYVAKEDLLERKLDINLAAIPWNFVDNAPTVTEADICREFVKKVDERFIKSFQGTSITYSECTKLVLAEMESEDIPDTNVGE